MSHIQLYRYIPSSQANGPGRRAVIWVQGCSLGCPGCFNPQSHPFKIGEAIHAHHLSQQVLDDAARNSLEGITLSGGEPLLQANKLLPFLETIRSSSQLSVIMLTGFSWDEIQKNLSAKKLLPFLDVVIAGRFVQDQRIAHALAGSANKTVHFLTQRYTMNDFEKIPPAEVWINPGGEIFLSGVDPLQW